ncbi:hypothetical protein GGI42DRAFT_332747, partial [Trichoderma sp. SZMC 28013]
MWRWHCIVASCCSMRDSTCICMCPIQPREDSTSTCKKLGHPCTAHTSDGGDELLSGPPAGMPNGLASFKFQG